MAIAESRWWLICCMLAGVAGCNSLPTSQPTSGEMQWRGQTQDSVSAGTSSGYQPWAWGAATSQSNTAPQPAATNATNGAGPMIAGPSSASSQWRASAPAGDNASETPAIPPPMIPPELAPSAADGVSLGDAAPKEPEKKGFQWSDMAPESIYKNIQKATGYGPNEKLARTAMKEGTALFNEKKYAEAAGKFATAANRWPDTPLEEDALFMKAESEFFEDHYKEAHDTYGGLLKKYTNTRYLDTVCAHEFAIGRYWEQLYVAHPMPPVVPNFTDNSKPMFDTFGYAVQAYERIRQNAPTGPYADAALLALGNAYFVHGYFEEAAYNYDQLRNNYANSKYQLKAHLYDLQAKMRVYQGTAYDEAPLNDAKQIAEQLLKQFGNKLGDERPRVERALAQILEEKANRDYAIAKYYDQHACYGAARMYYKGVVDGYPNTERAKESQARLAQIREFPDEPPDYLKWVKDTFSTKKK
ncbi:MAG: outer membrane protein assembly factor BamD [Thermoguttaceae bacterium]